MYTLNDRQIKIVRCLLGKSDFLTTDALAAIFDVSNRTVRNDLAVIRSFLEEQDMELSSIPNHGIRVVASEQQKNVLSQQLVYFKILSPAERVRKIQLYLLVHGASTMDELAECCRVSKQTVTLDLPRVEAEWNGQGLKVSKQKGIGLTLDGSEYAVRVQFMRLVHMIGEQDGVYEDVISRVYDIPSLGIVRQILMDVERDLSVRFYERKMLEIVLCYILNRIAEGHLLGQEVDFDVCSEKAYKDLLNELKRYPLPSTEREMLCSVLLNTNHYYVGERTAEEELSEARYAAGYLVQKLQEIHPLEVTCQKNLLDGLSVHLNLALYRMRSGAVVRNELLDQIKISVPLLYEFTKKELRVLEKTLQVEFSESEIAYIAMYLASAYEKSVNLDVRMQVLLVCSFGLATSSILKTRIEQVLPECEILGPVARYEVDEFLVNHNVDLILSTGDMYCGSVPVITVHPLLYQEDLEYVKNRLFQLSYEKMCSSFLKSYAKAEKVREQYCIKDLVRSENIQIVESCASWEEAIHLAAEPLVSSGDLEGRYVNKMIEAVNSLGTYMVLVPQTAFIHAGIEDGIRRNCTSILILKKNLIFGNKNPKIVRYLVILGIKDKSEDSLLQLVYIFENERNREILGQMGLTKSMIGQLHR